MIKNPIKDEMDFLIAQVQNETDIAREIVEGIRGKGLPATASLEASRAGIDDDKSPARLDSESVSGRYYEEKLALKMLEFFRQEEKVVSLFIEAKKNYPLLAELMENKRPYLKDLLVEAKKLYEKNILGK